MRDDDKPYPVNFADVPFGDIPLLLDDLLSTIGYCIMAEKTYGDFDEITYVIRKATDDECK